MTAKIRPARPAAKPRGGRGESEAYGNGYIDLADFKYTREAMAETLRGVRACGTPCANSAALQRG
jgi:hypothetical protein